MAREYIDRLDVGGVVGYFRETIYGSGEPTADIDAFPGQRYFDTAAQAEWVCVSAALAGDTVRTEWELSGSGENAVRYVVSQTLRVGDNVLTDGMVTLGAGWSGSLATGFTHTSGNTEPLTFAVGAADGESYILEGTKPSTALERAILLSLGDSHESDPYDGSANLLWGLTCVGDNGALKITPANGFAGTLSNLTFRKVTEDGENEVTIELGDIQHTDMPNHLSGFWNIAMGEGALESSVNGTRNIAIGRYAERALKTGGRNIAIGTFSMSQMESGDNNLGIGADSFFTVKKARDCIVIGKTAMAYGAEYSDNIAIGNSAMYGGNGNSTTSKQNIALGNQAGYYGGGTGNVYIGTQAGYKNGNNLNTFIGQQAGKEATGYGCTAIGNQATTNTHSQSTAIGQGASTTKSKQVVIGADYVVETRVFGDFIVVGTDGVKRQIVFNEDGTCTWTEV